MSRVATNYPTTHFNNGIGPQATSYLSRSSSTSSTSNSIGNGRTGGHTVTVRSAAPPPVQKETVHACPLCNGPYKDPRVLPCTHTYCLNCIREKLIQNNCVTCPKCHHQVHPFDESDLNDLQRNLILSQEWRLNTRPAVLASPTPKKAAVTSPSIPPSAMPKQQDKRKSSVSESNGHESTHHRASIASLVNVFNKSSGSGANNSARGSRSGSVSNAPPVVPNLVRIYSEATTPRQEQQTAAATTTQQQQKPRSDSVMSTGKHDELTRIFEQATSRSQRPSTTSAASVPKRTSQAYEEITWDNLVHGSTPAAPSMPNQWQTATEQQRLPSAERPSSVSSRDQQVNVDNLRDIISSIHQQIPTKPTSSIPRGPIVDSQLNSRASTASRRRIDSDLDDDDDDEPSTPIQQSAVYATIQPPQLQPPAQHSRQNSYADSIRTAPSTSTSRQSPAPSLSKQNVPRYSTDFVQQQQQQQQQEDRTSQRAPSANLSHRRSSDRFPSPPPSHVESLDLTGGGSLNKQRSTSTMSSRSSAYAAINETNFLSTERFNPDTDIPAPVRTNNSSRAHSQTGSRSSTPTNRPASKSSQRETQPVIPRASSASMTVEVTSRVDHLLTDQKRLEREIDEQIKRLNHDFDDVRKQIGRKESSIHNEVRNIAAHLDEDITEHYHRKQKVYAELAANNNQVGTELERLKSSSNTNANAQQLWANLEQIEANIRNIRRAVEQQKEPQGALTFAEGRRSLGADTIGQITYNPLESHQRHKSPSQPPVSSSYAREHTSMNITPYKYVKIDHLATLEPEAIAITSDNKMILLGICNKLFILNDAGAPLKVVPLAPSVRGIAISKKVGLSNIAYISHDETVSIIDIKTGEILDCVKETDSTGQSGTFLPLGIDTDHLRGDVYVCDYRNSCVIKFDEKLEFLTQWRIFNHSTQYDEARPKLISVHGQRFYMIVEHSCKPYYNQGIAYTFSLHICDTNSGSIIKIIDADLLGPQRLRWPCSVQAINNEKCYILDTMTSGKYFNGHWQKHWSRVLEIGQDDSHPITELFQLDSEAATMAMTKQNMIIAANGDILFVDLAFLPQQENEYQNLP